MSGIFRVFANLKVLFDQFWGKSELKNFSFNPWNHRADISAQAYLKPSKKGKNYITKNFAVIPKKKLVFFGDICFEYNGELSFGDFSPKFYFWINYFKTRSQIQMWDEPVLRKVFCSYKTLNSKIYSLLGTDIFFGSEISMFLI
jgi:hypothetical protein